MDKPRILLVVLALGLPTCNQAILTAPSGSTLNVFANPETISSNGGVSVISALVIEPAGTVVADGTVVQFFTTLGDIDEQGKTNDGVARVNLRANGLSGVASILAISGGGSGGPLPSPSATPTPTTAAPVSAAASSIGPAASASDDTKVTIGNFAATDLIVTANPPTVTTPRGASQIRANVFDASGNPLAGVPVFFSVSGAAVMESGGVPQFTDSNGFAFDVMRVKSTATGTTTATVQARVPSKDASLSSTVDVTIAIP